MTEQLLRDLLDHDSAGPPAGVRLAGVDARARGIRRRRLAGSLAAAALALAAATPLIVDAGSARETAAVASDTWAGALARPAPDAPAPPFYRDFTQGGKKETLTFAGNGGKLSLALDCPAGGYALIWLGRDLAASGPCGPGSRQPLGGPVSTRDGVNEVTAALVKASDAGTGRMTAEAADELLAWARPYPARWRMTLLDDRILTCPTDVIRVDPRDGRVLVDC